MLKSNDGFVSSVTLIGLEIATTVHFIESIKQGCRIPGSGGEGGGAQAPPVFKTLSHKNAIKPKNLRL